jgi:hypothetical protein
MVRPSREELDEALSEIASILFDLGYEPEPDDEKSDGSDDE